MTSLPKRSLRILFKAVVLFCIFNYAFALVPDSTLWRLSLYNTVLPGQTRFPLENDLNLIFNSHEIAASPGRKNEYKVIVLGDSSTWGFLLNSNETFSSIINTARITTCKDQSVHVYNLGYLGLFAFKDLIILRQAMSYKPDLIIWNITLHSILRTPQEIEENVIIKNNRNIARELIDTYGLAIDIKAPRGAASVDDSFLARRDKIARYIQYQLAGIRSQAAGEEAVKKYVPLGMDVPADDSFEGMPPPELPLNLMRFDVLNAGVQLAGNTPIVIINEPIQIVNGANSGIRYNKGYPRWAYDQYRELMMIQSEQNHWNYIDLWDLIPPTGFSNTIVHHTAEGDQIFSEAIKDIILKNACP